jgi:hypothetical protein
MQPPTLIGSDYNPFCGKKPCFGRDDCKGAGGIMVDGLWYCGDCYTRWIQEKQRAKQPYYGVVVAGGRAGSLMALGFSEYEDGAPFRYLQRLGIWLILAAPVPEKGDRT